MTGKEQGTRHVVAPDAADAGKRLDVVLAGHLAGISRSRIKNLIEDGQVTPETGGAPITAPSARVRAGQTFAIVVPYSAEAEPGAEAIPLVVLYEDAEVLVLDKPAGLVVHPAPGNLEGTLVNALIHHCGASLTGIGGVRRPGIVHRLDKDTSGVMVVAKTEAAHASLSAQFKDRSVERAYRALAWGRLKPPTGDISGAIGRDPKNRKRMAVVGRGRTALTHYRTLRAYGAVASLLECRLATGRTHQIRVHLASRGHPVMGDPTYGGGVTAARRRAMPPALAEAADRLGGQALHAAQLGFHHPKSGDWVRFETSLPKEMSDLVVLLESL